jgi:hypothetical protein
MVIELSPDEKRLASQSTLTLEEARAILDRTESNPLNEIIGRCVGQKNAHLLPLDGWSTDVDLWQKKIDTISSGHPWGISTMPRIVLHCVQCRTDRCRAMGGNGDMICTTPLCPRRA